MCLAMLCLFGGCDNRAAGKVAVLDYGTYDAVVLMKGSRLLGEEPEILSVDGLRHREETTTIEGRDGIYFGFRLDPATLPQEYHLKLEYEHPPFAPPGETVLSVESNELHVEDPREFSGAVLWYFIEGFEYEMVPGNWTFRATIDSIVVAEHEFEVVPPR